MDPVAIEQPLKILGETIGFWVQTAVILLGAGAAVLTIVINGRLSRQSIAHNEKLSRQRATIDLLLTQRTDMNLIESKKAVGVIHNNGGDFTALAARDKVQELARSHILSIINNYEFIALGIREGALDESIYKRAVYSQVMRDWKAMKAFVMELRRQNQIDTLFQELELLAKRWDQHSLKCDA
ncbi:DUF4760 domain-containing protein [Pseudomonas lundensis]|uniref:DUF4760 domain-containing protein n=1 Tax=Pseudomonas lundensis TaxID=86185 RepID=UPI0014760D1D|nr:DUF4760 domain-containing protein [Pseudomonas lundensis]NMZ98108.1 DUF4760 domain-containing protein [Pseudomonas lundensis]